MEGIFPSRDLESPRVSGQYSHVTRLETESRSSRIKGTLPGWYMWMVGPSLMAGWGSWEKSEHSATDNPLGHQHGWVRCPSNYLLYVRAEELGTAVAMDRSEWREAFNSDWRWMSTNLAADALQIPCEDQDSLTMIFPTVEAEPFFFAFPL